MENNKNLVIFSAVVLVFSIAVFLTLILSYVPPVENGKKQSDDFSVALPLSTEKKTDVSSGFESERQSEALTEVLNSSNELRPDEKTISPEIIEHIQETKNSNLVESTRKSGSIKVKLVGKNGKLLIGQECNLFEIGGELLFSKKSDVAGECYFYDLNAGGHYNYFVKVKGVNVKSFEARNNFQNLDGDEFYTFYLDS